MPHAYHGFWKCDKTLTFCSFLTKCTTPCACHAKRHLNLQKCREHLVFCTLIFTSKCASRHNGVHFFHIGTNMWCFVHFDFEMCFAPQRSALFRHLNCQKWSAPVVFCTFWLRNVLRATTACTFSTSQLPKVVRTRRFSEPSFRPSGAPNHWKNAVFRDFPTFSRICIFFLLTLSLLLFFLLIFLFSLPFPALLFICPYCRKFDF